MTTISASQFNFTVREISHRPKNTLFNKLNTVHPHNNLRRLRQSYFFCTHQHVCLFIPKKRPFPIVCTRAAGDDADATSPQPTVSGIQRKFDNFSTADNTYLPLIIRMFGLDNDPLDREQAIVALWKYSLGGKQYVKNIMQFPGCVYLTVGLLRSESSHISEAAAGLLRMISSVNSYRDVVAESGAIEETAVVLSRPSLNPEVKDQSLCMLWNLSVDEKHTVKVANATLSPLLKFLDDEDLKVTEAAVGVLANLALSGSNHSILVEANVIPKLAKFLTNEVEASKVIRKAARIVLLELAKDDYYKILIMEEGLVLVPLIGTAAYASYKPALHSWPSLPDGTEFSRISRGPSRYGASELLLGLNIEDNTDKIDQSEVDAIVGRTQQQFLARIGAIEIEDERKPGGFSSGLHHTLLPWKDGVARLVLILELEDEMAIMRAAEAIANTSVNQHLCVSFRDAGAVKRLVDLLNHKSDRVRLVVVDALEKLSVRSTQSKRLY